MKEKISYSSQEGQEFQEKPHVSLMESRDFPNMWRVDLRWREDTSSITIDAQFNFVDGIDFDSALAEATKYGVILHIPVAKYENDSIQVLQKPKGRSFKEQKEGLQVLIHSEKTQRFHTH